MIVHCINIHPLAMVVIFKNYVVRNEIFKTIKRIHIQLRTERYKYCNLINSLPLLVQYGYFEKIKEFLQRNSAVGVGVVDNPLKFQLDLTSQLSGAIIAAIRFSRIDILLYFVEVLQLDLEKFVTTKDMLLQTAYYGDFNVMLFIEQLALPINPEFYSQALSVATSRPENFDMVKWLSKRVPSPYRYDSPIQMACYSGNLDMIQWLLANRSDDKQNKIIQFALNNGHLHVVEWLLKNQPNVLLMNSNGKPTMEIDVGSLAINGHFDCIKWLFNFRDYFIVKYKNALDLAAYNGHLDIVIWCHENLDCVTTEKYASTNAMDFAANQCHLRVVEWLNRNRSEGCSIKAMNNIYKPNNPGCVYSRSNQLEMIQWLHVHRSEGCTTELMDNAVAFDLETVVWLYKNRGEGCTTMALYNAAINGQLEIFKFLEEHYSHLPLKDNIFTDTCKAGHLDMVEYLHYNRTEPYWSALTMDAAATNNHFYIVKFLNINRTEKCTQNAIKQTKSIEIIEYLERNNLCLCNQE
ncbi:hypothetical protein PPL_01701 [Heterostelium album PN500]|uniref:Ankyrin repeat-containing protein n=1 Tax=Heterostelium pallidum (strain ATCC 26659 / Pp 5 / PN500) TaxID=670386 RepID=D3B085_HETP5|nr:hypothetical protein PPL_01701 [Heterostelium album PN500]EFA84709.1 hypothetical protein PPL_01701 [Heterostelium album PN500]|eukprot:XP_020436822.1 hypothetical protein PPL_01701 [Heterostelium album PN500]